MQLQTGAPSISRINPTGGTIGDQGKTITVTGENLVDDFGMSGVSITGGVTAQVDQNSSSTQATIDYSIPSGTTAGQQTLTMANSFGTSNGEQFTVGDPPAVVTNVSPATWTAGQSTSVTITGTGFGTAPTISVNGTGVSLTLNSASPDGTTIQATATVALAAPSETVTVSVQPGYAGNTFICGTACNGGSGVGTNTAAVQPVTPAPQIMFNGQNISGTTQTVMAGQQIALTIQPPSSPYAIQSRSWVFSNQSAITGGFVDGNGDPGTRPSASAGGSEAADPPLTTQDSITFYWVDPGDNGETVTYTYTLNNGQQASATATFNIGGPIDVSVNSPESLMNIEQVTTPSGNGTSTSTFYVMGLPSVNVPGIQFTASSTGSQNAGANAGYMWVQVLTDKSQSLSNTGKQQCLSAAYPTSALDNLYPYPPYTANSTVDSPQSHGIDGEGEDARVFNATMYLMWNAALPSGCTPPSTTALGNNSYQTSPGQGCTSIPIPLGSVTWSACADAINTQNPAVSASEWTLGCAVPQSPNNGPAFNTNSGFPTWQTTALTAITVNGQPQTPNQSCAPEP